MADHSFGLKSIVPENVITIYRIVARVIKYWKPIIFLRRKVKHFLVILLQLKNSSINKL